MRKYIRIILLLYFSFLFPNSVSANVEDGPVKYAEISIQSISISESKPPLYGATYSKSGTPFLIKDNEYSSDNGFSWKRYVPKGLPSQLPKEFRRKPVTSVLDSDAEKLVTIVNALDVHGLSRNAHEPPIALKYRYLRYRVSTDGGISWLYDKPIMQVGKRNKNNPIDGIFIGKNSFFLGDVGSVPLVSQSKKILIPVQATVLDAKGQLKHTSGLPKNVSYTEVFVLIGTWNQKGTIDWRLSNRLRLESEKSSRGLFEPTIAQFSDGRLLMVMRGSNLGNPLIPSFKWYSISEDGGRTWGKPNPWTYADGRKFYSPSSMSRLFQHSSGRVFWIGNISKKNAYGNDPRWPVYIGEVDPKSLKLVHSNLTLIDAKTEKDSSYKKLDLSHFRIREDRESGDLIISYPRAYNGYKKLNWVITRLLIN